jgi:lyso-ornithine lipid O-acyltransferase
VGVEWSVVGELPSDGAVVSNHLSYMDILLYSAVTPFVMVAKSEVRGWPLFGWLTSRAGTVYVTRGGEPSTYLAVNAAMAEAYRSGLPVLFFPEGTTTDGAEVLPFRRGLFHSVLNEGVSLRVAALRYSLEDASGSVEEDVCWWGDALLAPHLWRLLGMKGVRDEICFGGEGRDRGDRFVLSEGAWRAVMELYAGSGDGVAGEAELVEAL